MKIPVNPPPSSPHAAQPDEQHALWSGPAGLAWVAAQTPLDAMFEPIAQRLVEIVAAQLNPTRTQPLAVLDIGCGTGATTLAIAARLGAAGHCTGIDISPPMLALARERAREQARHTVTAADFILADAQTHAFLPGHFELLVSRFGVMFFADAVAALTNLRRAATPSARLCCFAWRSPAENDFMTTAERAAAPLLSHLPSLPPRDGAAPGQFAWADADRVHGLLSQAGWRDIELLPLDIPCVFDAQWLELFFTRLGPLSRLLPHLAADQQRPVLTALHHAFAPYIQQNQVHFRAACWQVTANAPS